MRSRLNTILYLGTIVTILSLSSCKGKATDGVNNSQTINNQDISNSTTLDDNLDQNLSSSLISIQESLLHKAEKNKMLQRDSQEIDNDKRKAIVPSHIDSNNKLKEDTLHTPQPIRDFNNINTRNQHLSVFSISPNK